MSGHGVVGVGVLFLAVGLFTLYYARWQFARYRLISNSQPSTLAEVSEGRIELEGTIEGAEDTVDVTIQDANRPVFSGWKVEQYDDDGDSSNWRTKGEGVFARPFTLATDDGEIEVAPPTGTPVSVAAESSFLLVLTPELSASSLPLFERNPSGVFTDAVAAEFESFPRIDVGVKEETPDAVEEFVTYAPGVRPQMDSTMDLVGAAGGDRRYYEQTLSVGDEVYVLGYAEPTGDDASAAGDDAGDTAEYVVTGNPATDAPFIISDMGESALQSKRRNRALIGAVLGLLALGIALPLVLGGLMLVL